MTSSPSPSSSLHSVVAPLFWRGDAHSGHIELLDQRLLPASETFYSYTSAKELAAAIIEMQVRGAPAIGITAAFGVVLGMRALLYQDLSITSLNQAIASLFELLADTRPTAVNLFWALDRMRARLEQLDLSRPRKTVEALHAEAVAIMEEDRANNLRMGEYGAALLPEGGRILTHCNTGGLATGGYGTALGVLRAAHAAGKLAHVWVDETRPYLQGARLTAWECMKDNLPATLITDSMAAHFMQRGEVDAVIVGADRIAADGSTANKIGTYNLAVLCAHHGLPFYVAAPLSTIDLSVEHGHQIPIEERSAKEVTHLGERALAPVGMRAAHPAFDVTPPALITAIITEAGVATGDYRSSLPALFEASAV